MRSRRGEPPRLLAPRAASRRISGAAPSAHVPSLQRLARGISVDGERAGRRAFPRRPGWQGATRSGSWNARLQESEGELLRAFPFPRGWPPADRPFNSFPRGWPPADRPFNSLPRGWPPADRPRSVPLSPDRDQSQRHSPPPRPHFRPPPDRISIWLEIPPSSSTALDAPSAPITAAISGVVSPSGMFASTPPSPSNRVIATITRPSRSMPERQPRITVLPVNPEPVLLQRERDRAVTRQQRRIRLERHAPTRDQRRANPATPAAPPRSSRPRPPAPADPAPPPAAPRRPAPAIPTAGR